MPDLFTADELDTLPKTKIKSHAEMHTDVLVIGAGPTGLACAIEAQKIGLKVIVVDKGCLVNSLFHYPANMVFFTTPELLEIGDTAFNPSTYWLPRLAIDPAMYALLPARWQSSRVTSGVSFVPVGRDIIFKVVATLFSESTFRNGDWFRATLSAVLRVSSNTASPVLLAKSARTIVSFSVSAVAGLRRVRAEVERSRDYNCDKNNGGGNQNFPEFPARNGSPP